MTRYQRAPGQLGIPLHRQEVSYSCGAAAVRSVLLYLGHDVPESELREQLDTRPENGTAPEDMLRFLNGVPNVTVKQVTSSLPKLIECVDRGEVVIVDLQAWSEKPNADYSVATDDGHYVVLSGYKGDLLYFADPAHDQPVHLPKGDLDKRWHDVNFDGSTQERLAIVVTPPSDTKRKEAARRVAARFMRSGRGR